MKKLKFKVIILLLMVITLYSCNLVQYCNETQKTIKYASERNDYIPLTVNELKQLIINDTTNYKLIVFYSPCCYPCKEHFVSLYPNVKRQEANNKNVKWYYILEDSGGIKYNDKFLQQLEVFNIDKYYLRDDDTRFSSKNENKWNNIINYIFDTDKVDDVFGIPTELIVSKDNRLKKMFFSYGDTLQRLRPAGMYDALKGCYLKDVDFNKIDTLKVDWKPYICTPEGICN